LSDPRSIAFPEGGERAPAGRPAPFQSNQTKEISIKSNQIDFAIERQNTGAIAAHRDHHTLVAHKVFLKSFCKSQLPHKCVNFFLTSVVVKDKLPDLKGN
jgi:hypothetical protein